MKITLAKFVRTDFLSAGCLAAALLCIAPAAPARAQQMMQLDIPRPQYTLGGFKYEPPKADGWRQIVNTPNTLSLVYAEQKDEQTIETRFGVVIEVHDIPAETKVENVAALAELSRDQMAESRKADLVGVSPVEAVPSVENLYTYRLLVHSPVEGQPDAYEVYYVSMSPDATQYVVLQCITKTPEYGNEIYFLQFYGSLTSLKYVAPAAGTKPPAAPPAAEAAKPAAH